MDDETMIPVRCRINTYEGKIADKLAANFGERLFEVDLGEKYDTNHALLFRKGDKFFLLEATGYSCWDGEFVGWELSLGALEKLVNERFRHLRMDCAEDVLLRMVYAALKRGEYDVFFICIT